MAHSVATTASLRNWMQRHRVLTSTALVLLLLGLLLLWALVAAVQARNDLLTARASVTTLREGPLPELSDVRDRLVVPRAAARRASDRLAAPGPALVSHIPLLGRSLAAERAVADAAAAALDGVDQVVPHLADVRAQNGAVDLGALPPLRDALDEAARRTAEPLARLERVETDWTPAAVRRGVDEASETLQGFDRRLASASDGVEALSGMLGGSGPRTVVVAVMNNAELRGAGGYASSFAVVRTSAGKVDVGKFIDVHDVADPPREAVKVPAPPDFTARYGRFLADTTLWKNVLMSPDVPASASVMCEVARLRPGVSCDGVVLVDIPAIARLVELTGPVQVGRGEEPVAGDDLVKALLVEAYQEARPSTAGQAERRARLRAAADEALANLLSSGLAGTDALRVLADAARGRHLTVWSARPQEQQALLSAGLAGSADPQGKDLNLVSVNQLSAGKLDYYVRRRVGVRAVVGPEQVEVTQRVTLELDAPGGLPEYVIGIDRGRLVELMDIGVSPGAQVRSVTLDGTPAEGQLIKNDTGSQRVAVVIEPGLANGEPRTWEVTYTVPVSGGRYQMELLPQPLAVDAALDLEVVPASGLELKDGPLRYSGPYDTRRSVDVRLRQPSWWDRPVLG